MNGSMADNRALLGSIDSSVGTLTAGFSDVRCQLSEALAKLDVVQKSMPTAIGYCWGPEPPILLIDGLGRKTPLPMMLVCSPDVRVNPAYAAVPSQANPLAYRYLEIFF
jgi:hypothetical protein